MKNGPYYDGMLADELKTPANEVIEVLKNRGLTAAEAKEILEYVYATVDYNAVIR